MATVYPCLLYRDAATAIKWLVDAFGLTEDMVMRGDGGEIGHAELGWRDGGIMIGSYRDSVSYSSAPGTAGVYLVVEDPDAHFARAVGAGAEVVRPLNDTDYGSREYTVRDLEGNVWNFGTYEPAKPA
jgi:uncharacterized glyoxalase superfamily protein PhnB